MLYKMKDLVEISVGSRTDGSDEDWWICRHRVGVRTSDTPTGEGTSRIRDVLRRLSREIYARKWRGGLTPHQIQKGDLYFKRSSCVHFYWHVRQKGRFEFQSEWFWGRQERVATKEWSKEVSEKDLTGHRAHLWHLSSKFGFDWSSGAPPTPFLKIGP